MIRIVDAKRKGDTLRLAPWHWCRVTTDRWVYLGTDEGRRQAIEVENRESSWTDLSHLYPAAAEQVRPIVLAWCAQQRRANGDSLGWWMNQIAGRNNLVSTLPIHMIQVAALKAYVDDIQQLEELTILAENPALLKSAAEVLGVKLTLRSWALCTITEIGWATKSFLIAVLHFLATIRHTFIQARAARRSRPRSLAKPKGQLTYILLWLRDDDLRNLPLRDVYTRQLPEVLEQGGTKVCRVPILWQQNTSASEVYRVLRDNDALITHDWLSLADYAKAAVRAATAFSHIRTEIRLEWPGSRSLVKLEKLRELRSGPSNLQIALIYQAVSKHCSELAQATSIATFELVPPEQALHLAVRHASQSSLCIGYAHSIVSRDFLAYHCAPGEESSWAYPDRIIANGTFMKSVLIRQGAPELQVFAGPALRQSHKFSVERTLSDTSDLRLLLMLPLMQSAARELVMSWSRYLETTPEESKIKVLVRPHPMAGPDLYLAELGWNDLPSGWTWTEGPLEANMAQVDSASVMSSTSVVDLALSGLPTCIIRPQLAQPFNALDHLEHQFPACRSVAPSQIGTWMRRSVRFTDQVPTEATAIKNKLDQGLGARNFDLSLWGPPS